MKHGAFDRSPVTHSPVVPQSLVYRIHAAGDWNCGWRDRLDLLRRRLNASLVVLGSHNFSNGHGQLVCESPESPALRAAYARYASRNPWFLSSQDYADGRVMSGEELISNRELIRMDFYRDVVRPFGLFRRLCAVAARRNDMVAYVATHRAEHQSAFRERHKSLLKSLLPHLSLAPRATLALRGGRPDRQGLNADNRSERAGNSPRHARRPHCIPQQSGQ